MNDLNQEWMKNEKVKERMKCELELQSLHKESFKESNFYSLRIYHKLVLLRWLFWQMLGKEKKRERPTTFILQQKICCCKKTQPRWYLPLVWWAYIHKWRPTNWEAFESTSPLCHNEMTVFLTLSCIVSQRWALTPRTCVMSLMNVPRLEKIFNAWFPGKIYFLILID